MRTWIAAVLAAWPLIAGASAPAAAPGLEHPKVLATGAAGRYGGTLITAAISDPRTLNIVVASETSSTVPLERVFEGLVETNWDTLAVEPALAESWTTSADGRAWTFRLRQGVRWSDGVPLTADDVVFNMEAAFTPGVRTTRRDTLTVAGRPMRWQKIDGDTIELRTAEPFGAFLRTVGFGIVPKHKLEAALRAGAAEFNKTWGVNTPPREIIGTGPFVIQSYVPGERIVFLRNPRYWKVDRAGHRLPYFARHVQLIVPNLDATRLKFEAGETDIYALPPRQFEEFKVKAAAGRYTVYEAGPTASTEFVIVNQNARGVRPPKLTWFTTTKFRQALSYAIDRVAISNQVYGGRGRPQYGPITPANTAFYDPRVRQYPYDPVRALALLAEAGFKRGPDGVLRDAAGNAVEFMLSTNAENTDRVAIASLLRQDFEKLGMRVILAPEAFNTLVGKLDTGGPIDLLIWGFTAGVDPHTSQNVWKSSGLLHRWNPKQERPATAWEAEIDRLFDEADLTLDPRRRKLLYDRWQEIAGEQQPLLYLVNPLTAVAARNTVANLRVSPFGGSTWNIEQMYHTVASR